MRVQQKVRPNVSHQNLEIFQSSQRAAHQRWRVVAPVKRHGMQRTIVWPAQGHVQDLRYSPVWLKPAAEQLSVKWGKFAFITLGKSYHGQNRFYRSSRQHLAGEQ